MKKSYLWVAILSSTTLLLITGCNKSSGDAWSDSSNLGSYRRASQRVLWGDSNASATEVAKAPETNTLSSPEDDFIPLREDDLKQQFSDLAIPQPKHSPGEEGSFLPAADRFQNPSASMASVFKTLHFNTDEHVLKKTEDLQNVDRMAAYLKAHPKTYIFVEGHCDQRGPEAYNLALGTKRANYIRSLLVQKGVDPEQIHTVSYGKERLANSSNVATAWAENRRAQFKVYQQQ